MAIGALTPLFPRHAVPDLAVPAVGGGTWRLADQRPEHFSLVVFYRGLHCPICATYVRELDTTFEDFTRRGVTPVAISTDEAARAEQSKQKWRIGALPIGYGLDLDTARRWGLYVSAGHGITSTGVAEPPLFSEPGLFLIRPDLTLYFGTVQTMPFARPHFADILGAVDFVIARGYPARGEVTGPINMPKAS